MCKKQWMLSFPQVSLRGINFCRFPLLTRNNKDGRRVCIYAIKRFIDICELLKFYFRDFWCNQRVVKPCDLPFEVNLIVIITLFIFVTFVTIV